MDHAKSYDKPAGAIAALTDRVITEAVLEHAGIVGRQVLLGRKAVITPSGYDYLRRNRVVVTRAGSPVRNDLPGVVISINCDALADSAAKVVSWSRVSVASEVEAAARAIPMAATTRVACCGGEPGIVACLVNRHRGMRAAVVNSNCSMDAIWRQMNPNVVCFSPEHWSLAAVWQLLRQFTACSPEVPASWKEVPEGVRT
ncbi:MAG: hypothetical protein R3C19_18250 [Planctomycetaceae bacterium]